MDARAASGSWTTSLPATRTEPDVGRTSVAIVLIVVVLPAPFGPRRPNTSPAPTEKDTPSTARTLPGYTLTRFSISSVFSPAAVAAGGAAVVSPAMRGDSTAAGVGGKGSWRASLSHALARAQAVRVRRVLERAAEHHLGDHLGGLDLPGLGDLGRRQELLSEELVVARDE